MSWIRSKSCHVRMNVVAAMPAAANANASSVAAGTAKIAHGDSTRPSTRITTMKPSAYSVARITDQPISPSATSPGPSGVERIAS